MFTKEKPYSSTVIYKIYLGPLDPVTIKYDDNISSLEIEGKICEGGKIDVIVRDTASGAIKEKVKAFLRQMEISHPKLKAVVDDLYANHLYLSSGLGISLHILSTKGGEIKCAFASPGEGLKKTDMALEIQSLDCAVQWMQWKVEYIFEYEWNLEREKIVGHKHSWLFIFNSKDIASDLIPKLKESPIINEFITKHKLKIEDVFSQDDCNIHIKKFPGAMEIFRIMAELPDIFPRKILELFIEKTGISIALPHVMEDAKLSPWVDLVTTKVTPDETKWER